MPFCPRCGAATQPEMAFCAACGGSLAPAPPAGAPAAATQTSYPMPPGYLYPPPGYVPPPLATGPVGRTMEPWLVVVLTIVTFGIYGLVYWWRVTREVDEHIQRPGHSHRLAQIGVLVTVVAGVAFAFTFIGFLSAMIAAGVAADSSGTQPPDEAMIAVVLGSIAGLVLTGLGVLAGRIVLAVAKYRVWQAIEEQERARGHPAPLNLGLMLALAIGGIILSGIGSILNLILAYMTQERLNLTWASRGRTG